MSEIISKELLSKIVGNKVLSLDLIGTSIYYTVDCDGEESNEMQLNIHELAYKCKEWAKKNRWSIYSMIGELHGLADITTKRGNSSPLPKNTRFKATTEPEAVFKACQWILDNKDNQ